MGSLLARVKTEESFGFSVSGASHQKHILSSGGDLGKLIEGQALTLGAGDSLPGFSSEPESADSKTFGKAEQSIIVGD